MQINYINKVKEVRSNLRDFQRSTVEYICKKMFDKGNPQDRMLVADEVGLGKTWIAKGVIANCFERWLKENESNDTTYNVFYICSNQQLANQNLKKLNFTKEKDCIVTCVNRLSLLALKPKESQTRFKVYSLTPDTSFNIYSGTGIKEERYIIFQLLKEEGSFSTGWQNRRLSAFLQTHDVKDNSWEDTGKYIEVRAGLSEIYCVTLKETKFEKDKFPIFCKYYDTKAVNNIWDILLTLSNDFQPSKFKEGEARGIYNEIICPLRKLLINACIDYLKADFFVIDEFQRFSKLLENSLDEKQYGKNDQTLIAHKVFGMPGAKILMLSATPFKVYTNMEDEKNGEHHYKEFIKVLKFLYNCKIEDWTEFEKKRSRLYSLMTSLANTENKEVVRNEIKDTKLWLENFYANVMVRTEKIIASNDPNAMIMHDNEADLMSTSPEEIQDFLNLDDSFKQIYGDNAPNPLDYAKSAPYAMSFLRDYNIGKKAVELDNVHFGPRAFLQMRPSGKVKENINDYSFPKDDKWPHSKLNLLMKDVKNSSGLLWCPPSLPYYKSGGVYESQQDFSKTLVFSAWKLVPKMVSTLVSYEAERNTIAKISLKTKDNQKYNIPYFNEKNKNGKVVRSPRPKLKFAVKEGKLTSMTTFLMAYPSTYLVKLKDPIVALKGDLSLSNLVYDCTTTVKQDISNFSEKNGVEGEKNVTRLNWMIPIYKDIKSDAISWACQLSGGKADKDTTLTSKYLPKLCELLRNEDSSLFNCPRNLSADNVEKIAENIALLSIASPAVCAYRAFKRNKVKDKEAVLREAAFKVGLAFIALFNKPESISTVMLQYGGNTDDDDDETSVYWENVLRYCADGNLQSMLDEYVYMLCSEYESVDKMADAMCDVISMQASHLKVDDNHSFCKKTENVDRQETQENTKTTRDNIGYNMRTYYAAPFGIQTKQEKSENRATNIRAAFNSPFKPFVLTTTSIGQEGLDFHWYCRRIMHWNLPSNPVDFEQREGRINRFQGSIIRKRIVALYRDELVTEIKEKANPWEILFRLAERSKETARFKCDIVPNWHIECENTLGIERIVPLYKFSSDIQRYQALKKTLGTYRLAFGQPRQEELLESLSYDMTPKEKDELLINLCPMKRTDDCK